MAELNGKKILFSPHIHVEGIDTSDATATAADIASGKTAYARDTKLTGTAPILWTGTQAEYDALSTYDNNTFYFITAGVE